MTLSIVDLPTVTVVATYKLFDGSPATGSVTFTPAYSVQHTGVNVLLVPEPIKAELEQDGSISVDLPIGNDPDYAPPFYYRVEERLSGNLGRRPFYIQPRQEHVGEDYDLINAVQAHPGDVLSEYFLSSGGSITGSVIAHQDLDVFGELTVEGDTTVENLTINGTLDYAGPGLSGAVAATTLHATGAADLDTTLNVDGNTTLGGTLAVAGATTVDDLTVGGNFSFGGGIVGNTTITGDVAITGDFTVSTRTGDIVIANTSGNRAALGTALNTAIAALPATGGRILIPSAGASTWTVDTDVLRTKNGIHITGLGATATTLQLASGVTGFRNSGTTQGSWSISNMTINGSSSGVGTAIDCSYSVDSRFENLRLGTGTALNKGVYADKNGTYGNQFRNIRGNVAGSGSAILTLETEAGGAAPGANENVAINIKGTGTSASTGIIANALQLTLIACSFEQNFLYGIYVGDRAKSVNIVGAYIEHVATGLYVDPSAIAVTLSKSNINDCTTANITDSASLLNVENSYIQYVATNYGRIDHIGTGMAPSTTIRHDIQQSGSVVGHRVTTITGSGTNTQPNYQARGVDAGNRALATQVTGDAANRHAVMMDGKQEWGDGTASRDTNLYRSSADVLKTDDSFHVAANLRLNTTSVGSGVGVMGIGNATTTPAGTPTAGGVLYVEAGELKYKGSSGTVTTVAPA